MATILITNDDGYFSEGVHALRDILSELGRVVVVAPDRNLSGVGHSLTFTMPLKMRKIDEDFYTVIGGTPADCIHLGYHVILEGKKPDLVCAGINEGPNLGEDITYSGTVSGAMEGRILGIPSIAFSVFSREDIFFNEVAKACRLIAEEVLQRGLPQDTYLNVNVPNLKFEEIKGVRITRQGHRNYREKVFKYYSPYGEPIYWIAAQEFNWSLEEGTDFWAVANGYISVTPLHLDLTNYNVINSLRYLER